MNRMALNICKYNEKIKYQGEKIIEILDMLSFKCLRNIWAILLSRKLEPRTQCSENQIWAGDRGMIVKRCDSGGKLA